jgi:hypothetical protein
MLKTVFLLCLLLGSPIIQALPLGSVSGVSTITCPTGFASGSTCSQATISCPNTANIGVTYGIKWPTRNGGSSTANGLILLMGGGGGLNTFNSGYVNKYIAGNRGIAQVTFPSDWQDTGLSVKNIKVSACRFATIANHIALSKGDPSKPFCLHGWSGGSGAVGYTMGFYNGESFVDAAAMSAGPVFGNITAGCAVPNAPIVTLCESGQVGCTHPSYTKAPQYIGSNTITNINEWTGETTCNSGTVTSSSSNANWLQQSIVSNGLDLAYPYTAIQYHWCGPPTLNNAHPQGQFFANALSDAMIDVPGSTYSLTVHVADNCQGPETVWSGLVNGMNALDITAASMLNDCVRHDL